jgi:hypothetical protein
MGISRSPEGVSTVNWYLAAAAGLLDELWLHSSPVTLRAGERLFDASLHSIGNLSAFGPTSSSPMCVTG